MLRISGEAVGLMSLKVALRWMLGHWEHVLKWGGRQVRLAG